MRYVTYYEEYPIYEPAEGGYYYAGTQLVETQKLSKRKAKAELERIWAECKADNFEIFGEEEPEIDHDDCHNYPWRRYGAEIYKDSYYIGQGVFYLLERHKGSAIKGWVPYC